VDTSRIHGPTTPLERVQFTRDGGKEHSDDQEGSKFQLDEQGEEPASPKEERERGDVASRGEDESGAHLDLTV
jgi:hypothetical protein